MGTIADIMTHENDGCDGESEAIKATTDRGSIPLIFFAPRLTVRLSIYVSLVMSYTNTL